MELSPGQQKALFAVVVIVLAGLGIFLISSRGHGTNSPSAAGSASTSAAPTAAGSAAPSAAPAPTPTGSASVNIYQWLPFTQQDLAQAAAVTTQFAIDYNTFSYHQNAASYVAKMSNLITPQLSQKLQGSYSTLGVAQARTSQKQISSGTASINSLRTFGASSITFVVTATQKLNSTKGNSSNGTQYAITVTGTGGSWQVFDIELASVGNQ